VIKENLKKVIVIDNYDSFTHNLVHAIEHILKHDIDVYKNDEIDIIEIENYDYIFISPGPGLPGSSGIILDLIKRYYKTKKIFGVCLGLQSIVEALDGELLQLEQVFHGIEATMFKTKVECPIYAGLDSEFIAGRYHSWVASKNNLPEDLLINCTDSDGQIMGIQHKYFPLFGVQFHPESIMTPSGNKMIENFLLL
jgi:anthranilate synthase component 2